MSIEPILAFAGIALAVVLMPGADTILVLRTSLRDGARSGIVTALGVVCGPIVWGALAGLGVALILERIPILYSIVAIAGGLYLIYLASQSFRASLASWRAQEEVEVDGGAAIEHRGLRSYFFTGLMTNLLNPKIGVFYLAVMPGLFLDETVTVWLGALLGLIHSVLGLIFLSGVSVLSSLARRYLIRRRAYAITELVCGLCLLAFGVFVLVEVARGGLF
ncbi:LysE family translocator [Rathayibacter tanaceti]|uniref:LysE family transporter n=2 Tax=Rathayibacter tanaceti TaxID=1671680 RepID=A0A166IFP9_9MICO|nr:LysE family translocator [Rathayibacter tanaceti]KZX22306.1 Threonine efflux protein [Rathayibacter tanaceti]QHC56131.1 LysE family transporter [Rathayibacter tanaceti]TCO36968.1 threonine/homoserine/homoserine lactone efflux protein [Rathayibacter tanaceti]